MEGVAARSVGMARRGGISAAMALSSRSRSCRSRSCSGKCGRTCFPSLEDGNETENPYTKRELVNVRCKNGWKKLGSWTATEVTVESSERNSNEFARKIAGEITRPDSLSK